MNTVPQQGEKWGHLGWPLGHYITVIALDRGHLIGWDEDGCLDCQPWDGGDGWERVVESPPLPEMWLNVYPDWAHDCPQREIADALRNEDCLAVVHLIPDGDGYRVEVERLDGPRGQA